MQTLTKAVPLVLFAVLTLVGCTVENKDGNDAGWDVNGQSDGAAADRTTMGDGTLTDGAATDGATTDGAVVDGALGDDASRLDGSLESDRGPAPDSQSDGVKPDGGSGMDGPAMDVSVDSVALPDAADGETVPPTNPLMLEVAVAADPVAPSGRLLYEITVGNVSLTPVDDVRVLLRVPTGVQFNYSADAEPDSAAYCGNAVCSENEEASWSLGTLAAGSTATIVVNAQVLATVSQGAAISGLFTLAGTNTQQILLTKTVHVETLPSVEFVITTARNPLAPNESFRLDMDFGQIGSTAIAGAEVRATIPSGLAIGAISNGGAVAPNGEVVWTVGDLAVGATLRRSVDLTVVAGTVSGTPLTSRGLLTYGGGTGAVSSEYTVRVVQTPSPLRLDLAIVNDTVAPGERVAYVLTVSNTSARALDGVAVVLRVPRGSSFNSSVDAEPNASSYCGNAVCEEHEEGSWTLGTLASGTSRSIFVNASAAATLIDGNLLTARAGVVGNGLAPVSVVKTNHVASHPAAKIALTPSKSPVRANEAFALAVDIGHLGATDLTNAELKVFLPAGCTTATISDNGTQTAAHEITWSLGTVGVASALRRTVNVTVDASVPAGAFLLAQAVLKHAGNTELGLRAERGVTVVADAPPLEWSVSAAPSPGAPAGRVLYTMILRNASAREVTGIQVWLRVPEAMQFNYAADTDPDSTSYCGNAICDPHEEGIWTLATLAAGMTQTITVNPLIVAGTLDGKLTIAPTMVSATGMVQNLEAQLVVPVHQ